MASQRPSSSGPPDKDTFLGGGMQFNKVGTSIPGASPTGLPEEPVQVIPPPHARARAVRTALIIAALIVLVALLFVFSSDNLSGIQHTVGRGGVSSSAHPTAPPRNF